MDSMASNETGFQPRVTLLDSVSTTMEAARQMAEEGCLPVWDSVMALRQTNGRGQLRRPWQSPPGNLYASIRLPAEAPFDSSAAAVAMGVLVARALGRCGCVLHLKWPNDLVVNVNGQMAKVGGILLEEQEGRIIAGVGVNLRQAPDKLRPEAALPATTLNAIAGFPCPPAETVWRNLVKNMLQVYKNGAFFAGRWRGMAEAMLLWLGSEVEIEDGSDITRGIFCGLGTGGSAQIATASGIVDAYGGSMRPVRE